MDYLGTMDFNRTIRDYEFTRQAQRRIRHVVSSDSFAADMPAEDILRFFMDEMEIVSFQDHLKRYLYEHSGLTESFRSIPDAYWQEMIEYAFDENNAPRSFEPTTTRWAATVKSWLKAERVQRNTVFLLGFGLRMKPEDVSDLLMKVLKEDDFRLNDPREVIFRYCYGHQLPYAYACRWMETYQSLDAGKASVGPPATGFPEDDASLAAYLSVLKAGGQQDIFLETRIQHFLALFRRCREKIAAVYNDCYEADKPENKRRVWSPEEITAVDLEKMLCDGIPKTPSGNLMKASASLLNRHFESFRPSRQHLDGIIRGQIQPDRYDLLTLAFYLYTDDEAYGTDAENENPRERFNRYVTEANGILAACGMGKLYPVHPYEAFLMICLLSNCPLTVYNEVWALAYGDSGDY